MEQPKTLRKALPKDIGAILNTNQASMKEWSLVTKIECRECKSRWLASPIPGLCARCFRRIDYERLPDEQKADRIVSVVHDRYQNATLSTLSTGLQKTLLTAPEGETIFFWGSPGTGKTWAVAAMARQRIEKGYLVRREGWERLCLRIRDTFSPKATETEWSVISPLIEADTLILEDVGTTVSAGRQESDFSLRVLLVIMDSRSEDCLETFITSNKPLEEIENSFDPRIASRIRQGLIVHLTGKDRRRGKHDERTT